MSAANPGLLVIGHGTHDASGTNEFLQLAELLRQAQPGLRVEPCFLEIQRPTIYEAFAKLAAAGVRDIAAAPLLLFAAGHAKRDIPAALAAAGAAFPDVAVRQLPHLGCHADVVRLSVQRSSQALVGRRASDDAMLLMVGRGSLDPTANAEMARFSRLRWEAQPTAWLQTCFLAMTRPGLEESLEVFARLPFRRLIVQPHLLFQGRLLARIHEQANRFASQHADRETIVAGHLGPDVALAKAVLAAWESSQSRGA